MMHSSFIVTEVCPCGGKREAFKTQQRNKKYKVRKFSKLNKVHKVLPKHYKSSKTISGKDGHAGDIEHAWSFKDIAFMSHRPCLI